MSKIKVNYQKEGEDKAKTKLCDFKSDFEEFSAGVKTKFEIPAEKFLSFSSALIQGFDEINSKETFKQYLEAYQAASNKKESLTAKIAERPANNGGNGDEGQDNPNPAPANVPVPKSTIFFLFGKYKKLIKNYNTFDELANDAKEKLKETLSKEPTLQESIDAIENKTFEFTTNLNEVPKISNQETLVSLFSYFNTIEEKKRKIEIKVNKTEGVQPNPINENAGGNANQINQNLNAGKNETGGKLAETFQKTLDKFYDSQKSALMKDFTDEFLKELKKTFEERNNEEEKENTIKVTCNNCYRLIEKGPRFQCAECKNFSLCLECERFQNHNKEHFLIKINPIANLKEENELKKYDCIVKNNQRTLTLKAGEQKKEKVEIINSGEANLNGSFFYPIAYGDEKFVTGEKVKCNESITKEGKNIWSIEISLKPSKAGNKVSKWRMFSPDGIPFGDVLYLHLAIA